MMDSTWGSGAEGKRPAMRRTGASLRAAFLFFAAFLLVGCSPIQWYARQSGKGAVRGFYEGVTDVDEATRRRAMSEVLGDPECSHDAGFARKPSTKSKMRLPTLLIGPALLGLGLMGGLSRRKCG